MTSSHEIAHPAAPVSRVEKLIGNYAGSVSRLKSMLGIPIEHRYPGFTILLPANHMLPVYQRYHPNYDRFLPHLAKYIGASDTVIDVGANVGDTLAGMVEFNSSCTYVCIEPDDSFFDHLNANVKRIKLAHRDLAVHTVKSLVGKNVSGVSLEGHKGTKHAVLNGTAGIQSQPLDELLSNVPHSNIRLLKSDVDGFDYDVIESAASVIMAHAPILFFECQYDFDYQKSGYERMLNSLQSSGYNDWTLFDNFGAVMVRTSDMDCIMQLLNYAWRQDIGKATRTIHYYDILAVQAKDSELIDRVIADYTA